jgi:heptosyltransferase-2
MNVAVFLPNWIGDAVMATSAVRALRQHCREGRLVGVLKPYIAGVLEGAPWFDELIYLDGRGESGQRWPAAAARLRRQHIDVAVLFPNTFRSALVAWLGGCRRRIGYTRYGRGLLLTDRLEPLRDLRGRRVPCPVIDDYNRLTETAGCPRPSRRMELFTTPRDEQAADEVWDRAGFTADAEVVCLNPGAAFGAAKHWSVESFATLARYFCDRADQRVLVLCGPGEQAMARRIVELADRPQVHSLAEHMLSLGLTKACIKRAALLVTTDSGPRHFAAAFGRPVVTLFGPTHIAWTETYYARAVHLQKKVDCGPCQRRVCPFDHRCMKLLSPEEVFQASTELLAQTV